jgi:hypothetical protein
MAGPIHVQDGSAPDDGGVAMKNSKAGSGPTTANVRVVARIRPLANYEIENGSTPCVQKLPGGTADGPQTLQINQGEKRWFELDAVLDESCSQKDVYAMSGARNAIRNDVFLGFNCTILAYGQTGAGKSFTMGTALGVRGGEGIVESDGLIPRACHDLFETVRVKCDSNAHVECSYMEVYNEEIRDLLCETNDHSHLRIRETLDGQVYVRGLQARTVSTPSDVGALMEEANSRRVVASTKMNATSSRSHAICVLRVKGVLDDATKFESKLTLVDLAGSERLKKTEAKGSRAQEGISINKGLFVLGQVVSALAEQRPKFQRKPPFRDSKLTRILQDSLGGNSRTIMIACCSPADFNVEETINTLRYATQARNIKNSATANLVQTISQEEARKLKRENELLTAQIAELQETIKRLTQDVTEEELERSMSIIQCEMAGGSVGGHETPPNIGSPASAGPAYFSPSMMGRRRSSALPPTPELEHPEPDDDDADKFANLQDSLDAGNRTMHKTNISNKAKSTKNNGLSLDAHFSKSSIDNTGDLYHREDEELSLQVEDVFDTHSYTGNQSPRKRNKAAAAAKTYSELEEENLELEARLRLAERDVRATVHDTAIELPALKMRLQMLEESLNESIMLEEETIALKQELEEAKADKDAAQRAAQQLSDFMEQQKKEYGFRGDELEKNRLNYFRTRLDERWVTFVVTILSNFKEQMRLLGDYFDLVVRVVESPEILTMLGTQQGRKRSSGWFARAPGQKDIQEEKELRNRLLQEHIKFFNARLLEIEDEINHRTESVDAISDGLSKERLQLEAELDETEFVRDIFSKKGEKLVRHLTSIMTSPLFTIPTAAAAKTHASVSSLG